MKASHPDFEAISKLQEQLHMAMNPQCWWFPDGTEMPRPEYNALIGTLKAELWALINDPFKHYVNEMEEDNEVDN